MNSEAISFSCALCAVLLAWSAADSSQKIKKDLRDYTEADLERLYEQWEAADDDVLDDDELPPHKRKPMQEENLDTIIKEAKSPEEMMMRSKKGQSLMMFVGIGDVDGKLAEKHYTEKWIGVWQSSLFNNHIDVQTFAIEDNRAIFMFSDGSKAWEAKDFLLEQPQVSEVSLEGKKFAGKAAEKSRSVEEL